MTHQSWQMFWGDPRKSTWQQWGMAPQHRHDPNLCLLQGIGFLLINIWSVSQLSHLVNMCIEKDRAFPKKKTKPVLKVNCQCFDLILASSHFTTLVPPQRVPTHTVGFSSFSKKSTNCRSDEQDYDADSWAQDCGKFIASIVRNDRRVIVFPRDDTSKLTDVLGRSQKEHLATMKNGTTVKTLSAPFSLQHINFLMMNIWWLSIFLMNICHSDAQ